MAKRYQEDGLMVMEQRGKKLSRIFAVFNENFYVNIWEVGTNLTFRLVPKNTTKNLGPVGFPDTS
jgi:hypothetical protein